MEQVVQPGTPPDGGGGTGNPIQQPIQQQQPQQVQQVQQPAPVYQAGGKTGVAKFFEGVTIIDVIAAAMFFGALGLSIYYYRNKIKFMQSDQQALIDKVEELEDDVETIKNPVISGY